MAFSTPPFGCRWLTRSALSLLLTTSWLSSTAQDASRNFILTRSYRVPLREAATPVSAGEAGLSLQYFDGLGRLQQAIGVQAGPGQRDVVNLIGYDALGRQTHTYLPAPTTSRNGTFQPEVTKALSDFYGNGARFGDAGSNAFSETRYEASPLNRVIAQVAAGTSQPVTISYGVNLAQTANAAQAVKRYEVGAALTSVSQNATKPTYDAGQLTLTQTTDEDNKPVSEFTDKNGRVVLRRRGTNQETSETYYVYDDLGQLRAILQPRYQEVADLAKFALLYSYDGRGRLRQKQLPSVGLTTYNYNEKDLLTVITDPAGNVVQTEYDALNRPVRTFNGANQDLTYTYYDTYEVTVKAGGSLWSNFPFQSGTPTYSWTTDTDFVPSDMRNAPRKGQLTGGCVRQILADGTLGTSWQCQANYYDDRGRLIQTIRRTLKGSNGTETVSFQRDFAGKVLAQKTTQSWSAESYTVEMLMSYDASERLTATRCRTSSSNGTLPTKDSYLNTQLYNPVGQLSDKLLNARDANGSGAIERLTYKTSVRGWLREHRGTLRSARPYGLSLDYTANGNIQSQSWRYPTSGTGTYQYSYDSQNRLTSGRMASGQGEAISFDKNGNVTSLNRYDASGAPIDQLAFSYKDNQQDNRLASITDNSNNGAGFDFAANGQSYTYDGNNNITYDPARKASIAYNYLNLPRQVQVNGKTLAYTYDTGGQKRSLSNNGSLSIYEGSFEYDGADLPVRISTPEGQLVKVGSNWQWQYYLTDQLGNVRLVLDEGGNVVQETDYYPFGLAIAKNPSDIGQSRAKNKYLYLNRELQAETGYLDLMARFYDPLTGRFVSVDPLTDQQEQLTPYHYGYNNPLRYSDPNGKIANACCGGPILSPLFLAQQVSNYIGNANARADHTIYLDRSLNRREPSFASKTLAYAEAYLKGGAGNYTDANDAAVLTKGKNLDGTIATGGDKLAAGAGMLIPMIGGKLIKDIVTGTGEGIAYSLKKADIDLRGSGVKFKDALNAAFEATGVNKADFEVTKWGKDSYGKSIPVEYRAKGGAEVNLDYPHTNGGLSPDVPHIGWQTQGKGKSQTVGHIILDYVPAGRGNKK